MSKTLVALGVSVLLCASQFAHAYLPGSVSGPFYNPEQSGHGISITIATDQRAIAIWHVYNTEGDPLTLYIEGDVEGRRIIGQAYAPEGMRFGDFNKEDVQLPHWGSVDIAFDDCDHATLSWVADDLAYGDGEMPIRRLVQPVGVQCTIPVETGMAVGLYESDNYQGLLDENGVLWGLTRKYERDGYPSALIAGPQCWWSLSSSFVVTPTKVSWRPDGSYRVESNTNWTSNSWLCRPTWEHFTAILASSAGTSPIRLDLAEPLVDVGTQDFLEFGSEHATLVTPATLEKISGHYRVPAMNQLGKTYALMDVGTDGNVCVRHYVTDSSCYVEGSMEVTNADLGIFDFRLKLPSHPSQPAYFGRGWIADADYGSELVLVGHPDGGKGFGLVAIKQPAAAEGEL
ncbi:MAG: hypothetical protein R3F22_09755 [Lysobacteraceae bacterium]